MSSNSPAYRTYFDARGQFEVTKAHFERDGELDQHEMRFLLAIVETEIFPSGDDMCDAQEVTVAVSLGKHGPHSDWTRRRIKEVLDRRRDYPVIPFPVESDPPAA